MTNIAYGEVLYILAHLKVRPLPAVVYIWTMAGASTWQGMLYKCVLYILQVFLPSHMSNYLEFQKQLA